MFRRFRVGMQELRRGRAVGHRCPGVRVFGSHDERAARARRPDRRGETETIYAIS